MSYLTLKCQVYLKRHEKTHGLWAFIDEFLKPCVCHPRLEKLPTLIRWGVSGGLGAIDWRY